MNDAVDDMRHFSNYDYLIINDDFQRAVDEFAGIVLAKRVETLRQSTVSQQIISRLLG